MEGEYKNKGVKILTTAHGSNYGARYDWAAHIMPTDEDDSYWISSPSEAKLLKRIKKELENYKPKVGLARAKEMKKEGYSDSDIVQETGYHV